MCRRACDQIIVGISFAVAFWRPHRLARDYSERPDNQQSVRRASSFEKLNQFGAKNGRRPRQLICAIQTFIL